MSKTNNQVVGMKTIKISNKNLLNKFFPSFQELSALPSNPKTGRLKYAIKRSLGSLQDAIERYSKKRQEIFEERCKMDESGNPKFDKDKNYSFETKDLRKEAMEVLDSLDREIVDLTIYPIRKENIVSGTSELSIGTELNLGEFIIPTDEELALFEELNKEVK